MSESVSISHVATMSKPFGVNVEWKWPNGSSWFSKLELQCLREDGRLVKECIYYPNTSHLISGLKCGERVQVRVRIVAVNGSTRDWQVSDWIQGESSVDAGDIVQWLEDEIRNSETFKVFRGQCFINEGKIGNGIVSTNYNVKLNMSDTAKQHGCGLFVGIDVQKGKASGAEGKTSELKKEIDEWITETIHLHCRPGGIIWQATRRNR
ncbi:gp59 [Escherichia phage N15]|uniref:Gp59 n=1 Tax=Escherichia phage N15 TaxID=1604876 RepID=O64367_BPN15|nr:gp59 [Escherichia phage N15]AAC19096.1 gp59 [Escherichia phage N15]